MIMLELDGELAAADVDVGPPGRPALVQPRVDTDNFPDRPLARIGAGTRSEPYAQRVAEVLLQGGVVGLRCGNLCLEQHPAVDRQPAPIEGLYLVRHRDMGVQIRVAGTAVAVGERGRDSRAGDPDLHTHVAVANKVQTLDGRWLSIDGRVLFKAKVAASETYNTSLEQHLRDALGVRFAARPGSDPSKRPIREIVGVNPRLNQRWSTRRAHINVRRGELAIRFQDDHGRPPTPVEALHLAQQATLQTRDAKHQPRSLTQQSITWMNEAAAVLGGRSAVAAMVATALTAAAEPRAWPTPTGSRRPPTGCWPPWRRPGRPGRCGTSVPKPNAISAPSTACRAGEHAGGPPG